MGDVVELGVTTTLDLPAGKILQAAVAHDLEMLILVGREQSGELYFSGTTSDLPVVLWLLECAKQRLMGMSENGSPVAPHTS